ALRRAWFRYRPTIALPSWLLVVVSSWAVRPGRLAARPVIDGIIRFPAFAIHLPSAFRLLDVRPTAHPGSCPEAALRPTHVGGLAPIFPGRSPFEPTERRTEPF